MILVKMMFSVFYAFLLSTILAATSEGTTLALSTAEVALSPEVTVDMKESTENPENTYACLMYRLEDKLDRIEEKMAELERKANVSTTDEPHEGGLYAFSAHISETHISGRINGGLKFSSVDTNVGEAYNGNTGVFTSKADGLYVFNYQGVTNAYTRQCYLTLVHNNATVESSYAYSQKGLLTFGNSAVIKLTKGDVVHVAITGSSSCYLFGGVHTTFNGYKI
ncbi:collagen alpha-1(VIII) chain-like [Argopecten irradians]|uniref:collagen alpha-1(VIII) chain-like n=1 Tax=Argopecten irradians TaxID=31199 RepID=UPI0037129B21